MNKVLKISGSRQAVVDEVSRRVNAAAARRRSTTGLTRRSEATIDRGLINNNTQNREVPLNDECIKVCSNGNGHCSPRERMKSLDIVHIPAVIADDCIKMGVNAGCESFQISRSQLRKFLDEASFAGRQLPIKGEDTIAQNAFSATLSVPAGIITKAAGFFVEITAHAEIALKEVYITLTGVTPEGDAYSSGLIEVKLKNVGSAGFFLLAGLPIASGAQKFTPCFVELESSTHAHIHIAEDAFGADAPAAAMTIPKTTGGTTVTFAGTGPDGLDVSVRTLTPADPLWEDLYAKIGG